MDNERILFLVNPRGTNIRCFVWALGREDAKEKAKNWIGRISYGGPDQWIVTPLTSPGDRVKLDLTLNI